MVSFSPTALEAFLSEYDDSTIVMLNLIRFVPNGGREQYLEYLSLAKPILKRFGAEILFSGDGLPGLSAGHGRDWEALTLVRYPNRAAFKGMIADADYQAAFQVGAAAIEEIMLQPFRNYGAARSHVG